MQVKFLIAVNVIFHTLLYLIWFEFYLKKSPQGRNTQISFILQPAVDFSLDLRHVLVRTCVCRLYVFEVDRFCHITKRKEHFFRTPSVVSSKSHLKRPWCRIAFLLNVISLLYLRYSAKRIKTYSVITTKGNKIRFRR